jgi:hypothetical protein
VLGARTYHGRVLKGRLTARASVIVLVALTDGADGWSVATSSASSVETLHQAVEATIAAKSFTRQGYVVNDEGSAEAQCGVVSNSQMFRVVYQAPDRYEQIAPGETFVAVGQTGFLQVPSAPWVAVGLDGETESQRAATWLAPLLARSTVEQAGNVYRSNILPVALNHGNGFSAFNTFAGVITTVVKDGKVQSEDIYGTLTKNGGTTDGATQYVYVCGT